MKYNIMKLEQNPKGSVHCSLVEENGMVQTYGTRSHAKMKARLLRDSGDTVKYIVTKHWR